LKSIKLKTIAATLALGLCAIANSAGAAVLTFDDLTAWMYGDGDPLLSSMSYDGNNLSYQESGFQVTLNAPNADPGAANISTGTFDPQTYNWHDGIDNGVGAFVTLTRVGGGMFNLLGFDYNMDASAMTADGNMVALLQGIGSWGSALNGITELRLTSGAWNELDNIAVQEANGTVPLPGTLSLLLGGLAVGALVRRRQQ